MRLSPSAKLKIAASISSLVLLASPFATAQQLSATTGAVGYITLDIVGSDIAANGISFLGLGMRRPVEYQGNAEVIGSNSLKDNQATWTNDQFNGPGNAFYVEIASGSAAGTTYDISDTIAASKTITLVQNLAAGVSPGVSFKIRKHWTIASIFGPANEAGLQGGNTTTADKILIFDGTGYSIYFYQIGGFGTGWRNAIAPTVDAGGTVIYPDEGVILKRQQTGTISLPLMGAVKTGQSSIPVFTGLNIIGNVYAAPITLASSGLYTGNASTGLVGGNATTADQVRIFDGTGYQLYYYQIGGFGTGWRNAVSPTVDAGSTPIPVGSSVVIKRNGLSFNWIAPQHPASL